jgi:hypothetical protein
MEKTALRVDDLTLYATRLIFPHLFRVPRRTCDPKPGWGPLADARAHVWVCPTWGKLYRKQPLREPFGAEKPKVFWAFLGVQIPFAPPIFPRKLKGVFG